MKKVISILIFIFIISYTSGCVNISTDSLQKISPPINNKTPLQGKWDILKVISTDTNKAIDKNNDLIGKIAQFSTEYITVGGFSLNKPTYTLRKVNTEDYFLYNHKSLPNYFSITTEEMNIITISNDNKFFCQVLKLSDTEAILELQDYILYLKQISTETDGILSKEINYYNGNLNTIPEDNKSLLRTGVLIGLRYSTNSIADNMPEYNYRTLWISAINKQLHPIVEAKDIFFPRRSGFWTLEMQQVSYDGYIKNIMSARNLLRKDNIQLITGDGYSDEFSNKKNTRIAINYVGNDYISTEIQFNDSSTLGDKDYLINNLQVLPIDNLSTIKGIKISDILDSTSTETMKKSMDTFVTTLDIEKSDILNPYGFDSNFGLTRKMGHWFLEGRLNYLKEDKVASLDYNINLIPPSNIVLYDELAISWTKIKDRVPEAKDVYTSPNKDLAIILGNDRLYIYTIDNGSLGNYPIEKIKLNSGETIIMSEWATGSYVENWERNFISLKSTTLKK